MGIARLKDDGPFSIIEVMEPDYVSYGGRAPLPEPVLVEGLDEDDVWERCACCGAKLSWRVLVKSSSTDRAFLLGTRCASAAEEGIDRAAIARKRGRAERRRVTRMLGDEGFTAWLAAQPHPRGWSKKTRLDDVRYWSGGRADRVKKVSVINAAWREYQDNGSRFMAMLQERKESLIALGAAHSASSLPHPSRKPAHRKKTLADYIDWVVANRHNTVDLDRSEKLIRECLGASTMAGGRDDLSA